MFAAEKDSSIIFLNIEILGCLLILVDQPD